VAIAQDPAPKPTPAPTPPERGEPKKPGDPSAQPSRGARMVERMDTDGDGQLSGAEIPEFLANQLKQLDTDGDGALTAAEIDAMSSPPRGGAGAGGGAGRGMGRGDGGAPPGEIRRRSGGMDEDPVQTFTRLDVNKDGKVTQDEMPAPLVERLLAGDFDKDGALTLDEMKKQSEAQREEQAKRTIERLDANKDGKLTLDEIAEGMRPRYAGLDVDKDGVLTLDELKAPPQNDMLRDPARAMERMDRDRDGKLTGDEIPMSLQRRMAELDRDKDGALTLDELRAAAPRGGVYTPAPPTRAGEPL
jgi:Ca2+-binding EF-hand superfamily protein